MTWGKREIANFGRRYQIRVVVREDGVKEKKERVGK